MFETHVEIMFKLAVKLVSKKCKYTSGNAQTWTCSHKNQNRTHNNAKKIKSND